MIASMICFQQQSSTPLHYACQRGHQDIIALLIANGANTTAVNSKKQAPLDVIGELCYVRHDIVKAIKSKVSTCAFSHLTINHACVLDTGRTHV
jgi:Ankyrin repeat